MTSSGVWTADSCNSGTVGGLCYMLATYGTMSLREVLAPSMDLAAGFRRISRSSLV